MILELDPPEADDVELVETIHTWLEPAKLHIEGGGQVTVTRGGVEIGVASTMEELLELAIR